MSSILSSGTMQRGDFHYELPRGLIAQQPAEPRSASRLLAVLPQGRQDLRMAQFAQLLRPGDLLVFNDTRVIPARLFGQKDSGGRVELLLERVLGPAEALVQLRASKPPRPGSALILDGGARLTVLGREEEFFRVAPTGAGGILEIFERLGHVPLPPYIRRKDTDSDRSRYQTVFAREPGAVAAPTAGLHFDEALLQAVRERGVATAFLTLHVGAGTFQPLRETDLARHRMHAERYQVPAELRDAIGQARSRGGRVVAVGTTAVRALESAADSTGLPLPGWGETRLFITPGFRFQVVDAMLTNFHLPESTLLMLVCAFGGFDTVMDTYRYAVAQRYRFFSYGDAMFVEAAVGSPSGGVGL